MCPICWDFQRIWGTRQEITLEIFGPSQRLILFQDICTKERDMMGITKQSGYVARLRFQVLKALV